MATTNEAYGLSANALRQIGQMGADVRNLKQQVQGIRQRGLLPRRRVFASIGDWFTDSSYEAEQVVFTGGAWTAIPDGLTWDSTSALGYLISIDNTSGDATGVVECIHFGDKTAGQWGFQWEVEVDKFARLLSNLGDGRWTAEEVQWNPTTDSWDTRANGYTWGDTTATADYPWLREVSGGSEAAEGIIVRVFQTSFSGDAADMQWMFNQADQNNWLHPFKLGGIGTSTILVGTGRPTTDDEIHFWDAYHGQFRVLPFTSQESIATAGNGTNYVYYILERATTIQDPAVPATAIWTATLAVSTTWPDDQDAQDVMYLQVGTASVVGGEIVDIQNTLFGNPDIWPRPNSSDFTPVLNTDGVYVMTGDVHSTAVDTVAGAQFAWAADLIIYVEVTISDTGTVTVNGTLQSVAPGSYVPREVSGTDTIIRYAVGEIVSATPRYITRHEGAIVVSDIATAYDCGTGIRIASGTISALIEPEEDESENVISPITVTVNDKGDCSSFYDLGLRVANSVVLDASNNYAVQLENDEASPTEYYQYRVGADGVKGWKAPPYEADEIWIERTADYQLNHIHVARDTTSFDATASDVYWLSVTVDASTVMHYDINGHLLCKEVDGTCDGPPDTTANVDVFEACATGSKLYVDLDGTSRTEGGVYELYYTGVPACAIYIGQDFTDPDLIQPDVIGTVDFTDCASCDATSEFTLEWHDCDTSTLYYAERDGETRTANKRYIVDFDSTRFCAEFIGDSEETATVSAASMGTVAYDDCTDCSSALNTVYAWKDCDTSAIRAYMTLMYGPGVDYAYLKDSGTWYEVYNDGTAVGSATEPCIYEDEIDTTPSSCSDLTQNRHPTISPTSSVIDTAVSKFGSSSLRSIAGNVQVAASSDWNFGTGSFTVEFFMQSNTSSIIGAVEIGSGASGNLRCAFNDGAGILIWWDSNGGDPAKRIQVGSVGDYTDNTMRHFIIRRSGNTIAAYVNASSIGSQTYTGSIGNGTDTLDIPNGVFGGVTAWFDEIRVSNVARAVSVPSSAYTPDANTLYLQHAEGPDESACFFDSALS